MNIRTITTQVASQSKTLGGQRLVIVGVAVIAILFVGISGHRYWHNLHTTTPIGQPVTTAANKAVAAAVGSLSDKSLTIEFHPQNGTLALPYRPAADTYYIKPNTYARSRLTMKSKTDEANIYAKLITYFQQNNYKDAAINVPQASLPRLTLATRAFANNQVVCGVEPSDVDDKAQYIWLVCADKAEYSRLASLLVPIVKAYNKGEKPADMITSQFILSDIKIEDSSVKGYQRARFAVDVASGDAATVQAFMYAKGQYWHFLFSGYGTSDLTIKCNSPLLKYDPVHNAYANSRCTATAGTTTTSVPAKK